MRPTIRTLVLAGTLLPLACNAPATGPGAPSEAPDEPSLSVSGATLAAVLNTQLRGIVDPEIEPSQAYGHVQLKLFDLGDGTFQVEWSGKIFNPARETFTAGYVGIMDPDIEPEPGSEDPPIVLTALFTFFHDLQIDCSTIVFDSDALATPQLLSSDIANAMITDEEHHEVDLLSEAHPFGSIRGVFGASTPENPIGDGTDPAGKPVRCEL